MPVVGGGGRPGVGLGGGVALPSSAVGGPGGSRLAALLGAHRTPHALPFTPTPMTVRQRMTLLLAEMLRERASFDPQWQDLMDFVAPRRGRRWVGDGNRGEKAMAKIVNSVATRSVRDLQAGMLAGMASPSRPWFTFAVQDRELDAREDVREWLDGVAGDVRAVLAQSNFYTTLGQFFGDEAVFGTGALSILEDETDIIRCYLHPVMSYAVAADAGGRIVTFGREYRCTVRQLVTRFGRDAVTSYVREMWDRGVTEQWIDVCHVIAPNDAFDPRSLRNDRMPWIEVYFEAATGQAQNEDRLLAVAGYREFPVIVGRWELTGDDVYGTMCPGMLALPDVKMLMQMSRHGLTALAAMVKPPLQHPAALANKPISLVPGDSTEVSSTADGNRIEPIIKVDPRLDSLQAYIAPVIADIEDCFHRPLFRAFINEERATPPTAEEIRARQREKLSLLGPVLERHDDDVLGPAIERVYAIMQRRGLIPDPPEAMRGRPFTIRHQSEVALAQRLTGLGGLERYAAQMTGLSQFVPPILDNCDWDEYARALGDALGVSPKVTRGEEERAAVRQARAEAEEQRAAVEAAPAAGAIAGAARDLSETTLDPNSALGLLAARAGA